MVTAPMGPNPASIHYEHDLLNDRWIVECVFPGLRGGFFVEAGACSGRAMSASYVLETELGWDGICVEPQESYYDILVKTRNCDTDNRCLWDRSGESVRFTVYATPTLRGLSGVTEVNKNIGHQATAATSTVETETVTLHDLLEDHDAPSTVHYVCLDVEGAEERILEAFDFRRGPYRFLAVSIEGLSCDDLMREAGFVVARNPFTEAIYERYFLAPELAARRPELVRA
jgi:FkbM family methyltransferase